MCIARCCFLLVVCEVDHMLAFFVYSASAGAIGWIRRFVIVPQNSFEHVI